MYKGLAQVDPQIITSVDIFSGKKGLFLRFTTDHQNSQCASGKER